MAERPLKLDIYREFARIGQALASEARLLLLDLLAQQLDVASGSERANTKTARERPDHIECLLADRTRRSKDRQAD